MTSFYAILFLFFFQLLADFVEGIYAFGLLGTNIPPEIASVALLFSPLLLIIPPRGIGQRGLALLTVSLLATRLAYPLLDTRGVMLVAGLGVATFMLWLPARLTNTPSQDYQKLATQASAGLGLALLASILLRALGSGVDISTTGWTQVIAWPLAILALIQARHLPVEINPPDRPARNSHVIALSLGIMAALFLIYIAFSAPHVIARWTETSYLAVAGLLCLALLVYFWLASRSSMWNELSRAPLVIANLAFVLALLVTILAHQVPFPLDPAVYPFYQPDIRDWAWVPLTLTLLLSPVILMDFRLYTHKLLAMEPTLRQLGGAFGLVGLFMMLGIFAHVFTTVYDYIPVVGPFFRDKFWLVYLAVGLTLALAALVMHHPAALTIPVSRWYCVTALVLEIATLGGAALLQPRPTQIAPTPELRVLTYNIQQGYRADGQKDLPAQLALMQDWDADLIGLQECDSARIAGGNNDLVTYFANHLDMYAYYGPKTVTGTFGIALLSRYPIVSPRTFFMYSAGEQTATIWAQIEQDGRTLNVFVTHLGNDGPIIQQEAILKEINGLENVILMGDLNFAPDGDQYALTRQALEDAWLLRWPTGVDDQGVDPRERIDHVFVSPGTQVMEARYFYSPASDHPALGVALGW